MHSPDLTSDSDRVEKNDESHLSRTLFWIGFGVSVATLGAGLAYAALRFAAAGRREDPTTQRIQQLIDEANSLLKALDDQKHNA
jgi:hypothetical protein